MQKNDRKGGSQSLKRGEESKSKKSEEQDKTKHKHDKSDFNQQYRRKKNFNKIDKIDQVHSGGTEQNWQDQTDKTIKNTHKKAKATHDMAQDTRHNKNKTQQEHKSNPVFPNN